MRHATLEFGQVIPNLVYNLQRTIKNCKSSTISASNQPTQAVYEYEQEGSACGDTLEVMRWQPRRCRGRTTVLWAHLAAWGAAADGAEEDATSHRTAPRAPRRGRLEVEEIMAGAAPQRRRTEAEEKTAGAGASAAEFMAWWSGAAAAVESGSRGTVDTENRIVVANRVPPRLFFVLTFFVWA